MQPLSHDTSPAVEQRQIEQLRHLPPWRKLELAGAMNRMVRSLALRGLQRRFPYASDAELHHRFAEQRLGPDLATRVYGALACQEDTNAE